MPTPQKTCLRDTHNHGIELAMKVVRQARLELSGGSTPDLLRPKNILIQAVPGEGSVHTTNRQQSRPECTNLVRWSVKTKPCSNAAHGAFLE